MRQQSDGISTLQKPPGSTSLAQIYRTKNAKKLSGLGTGSGNSPGPNPWSAAETGERTEAAAAPAASGRWRREQRGGGRSCGHQGWALVPLGRVGIALELHSLQQCHVLLQFQGMPSGEGPLGSPPEQLHVQTHQISAVQHGGPPAAPALPPAPPLAPRAQSPLFGVAPSSSTGPWRGHRGQPLARAGPAHCTTLPMELPTRCWKSLEQGPGFTSPCSSHGTAPGSQWFQLTKPQPVFLHLLSQVRACSAKPHHVPRHQQTPVQDGPTRMGPPGCCEPAASSGAGNHTRPPALAPAPALPRCQAPPQFIAHRFKEKQHPVHAVPSRVVRSWPWIHVGAARTRCPLQPHRAALAVGLLLSTPCPCRTRDTPVPRASPSHVAQAVQG